MELVNLEEGEADLPQIGAQSTRKALSDISEGPPCNPQLMGGAHQRPACNCHRRSQAAGEHRTSVVEGTRHTVIWHCTLIPKLAC